MGRTGLCVIVATILSIVPFTGCGSPVETEKLPDGLATGPGFEFQLDESWLGAADPDEFGEVVAENRPEGLQALDVQQGLLLGGSWIDPEDENRQRVSVTIEPITTDTELDVLAAQSEFLLERNLGVELRGSERTRLDSEAADQLDYFAPDPNLSGRVIITKQGPFGYSIALQVQGEDQTQALDMLTERVVGSWTWEEPTADQKAELASLREVDGDGYEVEVPPGWRVTRGEFFTKEAPDGRAADLATVDSFWRGHVDNRFSTNVQVRSLRPAPSDLAGTFDAVRAAERSQLGSANFSGLRLERGDDFEFDDEPARSLEIDVSQGRTELEGLELITIHDRVAYTVTLISTPERYERDAKDFFQALESWVWD